MSLAEDVLPILDALLEAGEIVEALESSTRAVSDAVAEIADDVVANYVPAYAALKLQCSALPDCEEAVEGVRNDLFAQAAKVTGLWGIFSAIRQAWLAMPGPIREVAGKLTTEFVGKAKAVVNIATDVWSDPEILWETALDPEGWMDTAVLGLDLSSDVASMLTSWFDAGLDAVLGALEEMPILGPLASGAVAVGEVLIGSYEQAEAAVDKAVESIPVIGGAVKTIKEDVPVIGPALDLII